MKEIPDSICGKGTFHRTARPSGESPAWSNKASPATPDPTVSFVHLFSNSSSLFSSPTTFASKPEAISYAAAFVTVKKQQAEPDAPIRAVLYY
jgi:hypothetical protein